MTIPTFISLALLIYASVVVAMIALSQPARVRMVDLIDDLLDDDSRTNAERAHLEWLIKSATSSSVGLLVPVASLMAFAGEILGAHPPVDPTLVNLEALPSYERIVMLYIASVMASSPVAALISIPILLACGLVASVRGQRGFQAIERPVLNATAQFQPC